MIIIIQTGTAYGECHCRCFVLYAEALIDVACCVRRDYTSAYYIRCSVLLVGTELIRLVGENTLELGYGGVGLQLRHRCHQPRVVEVILAGGCAGCCQHTEAKLHQLLYFHGGFALLFIDACHCHLVNFPCA